MKKWLEGLIACAVVALPFAALEGCAQEKGEGSETHFVSCKTDTECVEASAGNRCVDEVCRTVPAGTGGSPSGGRSGSGGAASAGSGSLSSSGGSDAGGGGSDAGGAKDSCAVPGAATPLPPDYEVTFTFTNESGQAIALWEECFRHFEVLGCADDYAEPLPYSTDYAGLPPDSCGRECPDRACGCLGTCQSHALPVTADLPVVEQWDGNLKNRSDDLAGCGCVETAPASPGRYRVRVPVYAAGAPFGAEPLYRVTADFVLGAEAAVRVVIPLDRVPDGD